MDWADGAVLYTDAHMLTCLYTANAYYGHRLGRWTGLIDLIPGYEMYVCFRLGIWDRFLWHLNWVGEDRGCDLIIDSDSDVDINDTSRLRSKYACPLVIPNELAQTEWRMASVRGGGISKGIWTTTGGKSEGWIDGEASSWLDWTRICVLFSSDRHCFDRGLA